MRWARVASVRAGDRSIGRAVRPVCAAGLAGCWRPGLGPPRWSSDIDGVTAWWCRMPVSRRCRLWSVSAVVGVGAWRARGRRQGPDRGRPPVAGPGHGARHRIAPVRWMRPHRRLSGHPARTRDPRPTTVVQRVGITAGPGAAGRVRRWHPARAVTGIVRGVGGRDTDPSLPWLWRACGAHRLVSRAVPRCTAEPERRVRRWHQWPRVRGPRWHTAQAFLVAAPGHRGRPVTRVEPVPFGSISPVGRGRGTRCTGGRGPTPWSVVAGRGRLPRAVSVRMPGR